MRGGFHGARGELSFCFRNAWPRGGRAAGPLTFGAATPTRHPRRPCQLAGEQDVRWGLNLSLWGRTWRAGGGAVGR